MKRYVPLLFCGIVFVMLLFAGCTGSTGAASTLAPAPAGTTVPASPAQPSMFVVKNTGSQEIHAWVSSDTGTWQGSSENHIEPGAQLTLSYSATAGYVCIGKSEKVLTCTALSPSVTTLTWNGSALS